MVESSSIGVDPAQGGMAEYIAFIGDIVGSKKLSDRSEVQDRLREVLQRLNRRGDPGVLSPYTITLGDEFQAVLGKADRVFLDTLTIWVAMEPVRVRFSFGIGRLETPINPKEAIGMDGPAFHRARQGINDLKETSDLFTISGDRKHGCIALMKPTLALISHLTESWKPNRWQILLRLYEEISVKEVAEELKISDSAVYKNIESGDLRTIIDVFKAMATELDRALQKL